MASISKIRPDGPAVLIANAVHIIEWRSDSIEFEILEENAGSLKNMLGETQLLACDGSSFWGELISLTPSAGSAGGLGLLRERPTLKGVIRVFPDECGALQ